MPGFQETLLGDNANRAGIPPLQPPRPLENSERAHISPSAMDISDGSIFSWL